MSIAGAKNKTISVAAHRGDAKTLLAFDIIDQTERKSLAGFTIRVKPPTHDGYYLINDLVFEHPDQHAQDPSEPANSTMNAPIHKFRWLHVPGLDHQGLSPEFGNYTYTVTPRYFDGASKLLAFDKDKSVDVQVLLAPFEAGKLKIGFTRGFTQSQAFAIHFGKDAPIRPNGDELLFDTSAVAGQYPDGKPYTFEDEYAWSGFTARQLVFELLGEVEKDDDLHLDVFAYDLNEPDVMKRLIGLAGRTRIILDNAALHHNTSKPKPEDRFAAEFAKAGAIKRGHFGRYAHDKVFIISKGGQALKVLTGSTNLSVTGMYVNSNHVLVFDEPSVADLYFKVFDAAWNEDAKASFKDSDFAKGKFPLQQNIPPMTVSFAPHQPAVAEKLLGDVVDRINVEGTRGGKASVLFAVMDIDNKSSSGAPVPNPVYDALKALHANTNVFSFGISDDPGGISLYKIGSTEGVIVAGKLGEKTLPAPFNQIHYIEGLGHQVHHKFVVCGFRSDDPTVVCGSSNLALGGEESNGDNLLTIKDADVATVFAIEAVGLVDHFNFLDGLGSAPAADPAALSNPNKREAAVSTHWYLSVGDGWSKKYFDPNDLHSKDRELFAW